MTLGSSPVSVPAFPLSWGAGLFVSGGSAFIVTAGGLVSMTKVMVPLTPAGFPIELGCVACAVYAPSASCGAAGAEVHAAPVGTPVAVATGAPWTAFPL